MHTTSSRRARPLSLSANVRVLLARAGYLETEAAELTRDRAVIAEALRRLQRDRGLPVTGALDAATAATLDRPFCGTAAPGGPLRFRRTPFPWPYRELTYGFVHDNGPGSSPTPRPPAVTQTLSIDDACAAVRRALDTWQAQEGVDPGTGETYNLGLRFQEISFIPESDPDIIFTWKPFPCEHLTMSDSYGAHADFPPGSVQYAGEGNEWFLGRTPVDFNDDVQVFTSLNVEYFTLHEVGHVLGLEHSDDPAALMAENPLQNYRTLQPDDERGIQALYPPQGPERYNGIWAVGTVDRRAAFGLAGDEVEPEVDRQKQDGYKLARLNAFFKPNAGLRYNAIFEEYGGDRIRVQNRTRESFNDRADELKAAGWRPLSLSTVMLPEGEDRWNAVFTRDGATGDAVWGFERADVLAVIKANKAKRLGLVELNAYVTADGEERFNAVFWKRDRETRFQLGYQRDDVFEHPPELEGFSRIDVNAYVLPGGKGERWNAVYERLEVDDTVYVDKPRYDLRAKMYEPEEVFGLRPWILNAFVPQTATTTTGGTTTIPHPAPPEGLRQGTLGIALDERRAYVTRYEAEPQPPYVSERLGVLEAVDRDTAQVVGAPAVVGFRPRAVALNPVTRRLYVVNLDPRSYTVTVVDADSMAVVTTITVGQGPSAVAVNPATNRIYVSNWFARRVQVIDGATNALLAPIDTGPGPQGIAVDPATNRLYVALSNRSFTPFVNGVAVYTDDGTTVAPGPRVDIGELATQSVDVAVDPTADRIYVANLGGGGVHPSVTALRASSLAHVATVPVPGPCRAIACNGDAREIYVAGDRGLQVLDTTSLRLRRSFSMAGQPFAVACDEGSERQVWAGGVGTEAVRLA